MYVSVDIQVWDKNSYWIAYKHSHILYAYKVILYIIYHMKKLFHTELTHTHIWKHIHETTYTYRSMWFYMYM